MAKNAVSTSEIKRKNIPEAVKLRLWGQAAGRCEICNKILYLDSHYGDNANFAQNAHIHAVAATGPRHISEMSKAEIDDINNLMLLCAEHHHLIDSKPETYPGDMLIRIKKEHEERIRRLTEIQADASCRMITYFSNIDNSEIFSSVKLLRRAVVMDGLYPKQDEPIALHDGTSTRYIATMENFQAKAIDLELQVKQYFGSIIKQNEVIAIFALAPMPLLFKLGTLINDQFNVRVFQCHREGDKWAWPNSAEKVKFILRRTNDAAKDIVALVIDLSADVMDSRITNVLGDCSIYHITINSPNRNFVRNKETQDEFVHAFRKVMEEIRNNHPEASCINLFPAMPQSLAIRAGMDYMPKIDLPIKIYEQVSAEQGFIEVLKIGG